MNTVINVPRLKHALCAAGLLLTACSTAQPTVRGSLQSEGGTTRVDEYASARPRSSRAFDIVLASGRARDCDAEHNKCFDNCWNSPSPWSHVPAKGAQHYKHCTSTCLEEYMECCKQQELRPRAFPSMKTAMDWLKDHKTEVLAGSVVIVAGAAFVVAVGAAGALVLLPLAAL